MAPALRRSAPRPQPRLRRMRLLPRVPYLLRRRNTLRPLVRHRPLRPRRLRNIRRRPPRVRRSLSVPLRRSRLRHRHRRLRPRQHRRHRPQQHRRHRRQHRLLLAALLTRPRPMVRRKRPRLRRRHSLPPPRSRPRRAIGRGALQPRRPQPAALGIHRLPTGRRKRLPHRRRRRNPQRRSRLRTADRAVRRHRLLLPAARLIRPPTALRKALPGRHSPPPRRRLPATRLLRLSQ